MPTHSNSVVAECGATVAEGTAAYDYYNMKPGHIVAGSIKPDGWFSFRHTDGTTDLLNGQRICSVAFAQRRGFPGA